MKHDNKEALDNFNYADANNLRMDDLGERTKATIRAALTQPEQEWQPIATAPRDGTVIILAGKTRHAKYDHVDNGHWYSVGGKWVWHHYLGDEPLQPTHWMPLPNSPIDK